MTVVSAGPGAGFMLQRAVQVEEISSEAAPQAGAQPAAGSGGAGTGDAGTGSIPGSGGAGPGAPGGATGPGASEADLDLLARRLYGRLRERLVRELMLDRERAGMLADR